jgi:exosortase/archaeosortase family protein
MSGANEKTNPELVRTDQLLLAVTAAVLMLLPLMFTISNALDSFIYQFQAYTILQSIVAPTEARMIAAVLQYLFRIHTVISGSTIILLGQPSLKIYVSWICVGWQSLALYFASAIVGLSGPHTIKSKLLALVVGLEGTFLINLLRETSVILVNMYIGDIPAILYHTYGGTIIVTSWLAIFWYLSYATVLKRK